VQELRDIKPLIELSDYSLYLLISAVVVGLIFAYKLFIYFYKYAKGSCKVNCNKYYFYMYCNLDWSKPKEAAYLATKYAAVLAIDKRRAELYEQLRVRLDRYKYTKNIDKIDSETMNYYNLYKQVCDESL
jgi:hypothetical protein